MRIIFSDEDLKRCAVDRAFAFRRMGMRRALCYVKRLEQIYEAECFESLRNFPGRYHTLIGNRSGQWACDLDQPYRLIFKSTNQGPVTQIVWSKEKVADVLEVVNYHG